MAGINLSVAKALDVLDLLGQSEGGLRLKDIAAHLDLPESTTHRLLASLAARDFVQQRTEHGTYALGWKIAVLARVLESDARLVQAMQPHLAELARQVGQTINLGVLSNDHVVYLDCQLPSQSFALYTAPGTPAPLHATSLGKTLLAFRAPAEREAILDRLLLRAFTPQTLTTRPSLDEALEAIRERGYALDHGEYRANVTCLAAPLRDDRGRAVAAISLTAPTAELPPDWEEVLPPRLLAVAAAAAAELFGAVPTPEPAMSSP